MEQIKGNIILTVAGSDVIVSDVAPTNIDIDQLWLDTTANKLKQWDGTEWISVNDNDELLKGVQEIIHTQGLQIEENKQKVEQLMTDTTIQKSDGKVVAIQEFYNDSVDTAKQYSKTIGALNDRADGGIRTWHGTEVPTISNYPANMWIVEKDELLSNEVKDLHIGDVYYLDNAENENILCYGFIKDVSTYKWKILTDEEVKVALKNAYKTSDDRISKYTQTADMFSWLVADDFSKSNVMLSSNAYDVIAENITLKGNRIQLDSDTYVGEGFVLTADNINVETLFSNSITVKNSLLLNGGYLTTSSIRTSYNQSVVGMTMDKNGIGGWYSSDQYWNMTSGGKLTASGAVISGKFTITGGSINIATSSKSTSVIQLSGEGTSSKFAPYGVSVVSGNGTSSLYDTYLSVCGSSSGNVCIKTNEISGRDTDYSFWLGKGFSLVSGDNFIGTDTSYSMFSVEDSDNRVNIRPNNIWIRSDNITPFSINLTKNYRNTISFTNKDSSGEFQDLGHVGFDKEGSFIAYKTEWNSGTFMGMERPIIKVDKNGNIIPCLWLVNNSYYESLSTIGTSTYQFDSVYSKFYYENGKALSQKYATIAHDGYYDRCNKGSFGNACTYNTTSSVTSGNNSLVTSDGVWNFIHSLGLC